MHFVPERTSSAALAEISDSKGPGGIGSRLAEVNIIQPGLLLGEDELQVWDKDRRLVLKIWFETATVCVQANGLLVDDNESGLWTCRTGPGIAACLQIIYLRAGHGNKYPRLAFNVPVPKRNAAHFELVHTGYRFSIVKVDRQMPVIQSPAAEPAPALLDKIPADTNRLFHAVVSLLKKLLEDKESVVISLQDLRNSKELKGLIWDNVELLLWQLAMEHPVKNGNRLRGRASIAVAFSGDTKHIAVRRWDPAETPPSDAEGL